MFQQGVQEQVLFKKVCVSQNHYRSIHLTALEGRALVRQSWAGERSPMHAVIRRSLRFASVTTARTTFHHYRPHNLRRLHYTPHLLDSNPSSGGVSQAPDQVPSQRSDQFAGEENQQQGERNEHGQEVAHPETVQSQATDLQQSPKDVTGGDPAKAHNAKDDDAQSTTTGHLQEGEAETSEGAVDTSTTGREKRMNQGAFARRSTRSARPREIPPIILPQWFLERNVKLHEDKETITTGILKPIEGNGTNEAVNLNLGQTDRSSSTSNEGGSDQVDESDQGSAARNTNVPTYRVHQAVLNEISASVSAGLSLSQSETSNSFPGGKSHLKLHCPVDGGDYMLQKIVEQAAAYHDADLVVMDAQDIAELCSDYVKEGRDAASNGLWTLGYDAHPQTSQIENDAEEQDEDLEDESMDVDSKEQNRQSGFASIAAIPVVTGASFDISDTFKRLLQQGSSSGGKSESMRGSRNINQVVQNFGGPQNSNQQWNDMKLAAILEALTEANQTKRHEKNPPQAISDANNSNDASADLSEANENADVKAPLGDMTPPNTAPITIDGTSSRDDSPKTVILVRDFKEILGTQQGWNILDKILDVVERRRKLHGQNIMIIGTTASSELTPGISRSAIDQMQSEGPDSVYRTIFVTPSEAGPSGGLYYDDERRRILEINVRHIRDMVRRLDILSGTEHSVAFSLTEFQKSAEDRAAIISGLEEDYLTFDEVHRIVLTAMGMENNRAQGLTVGKILSAIELLEESDDAKSEWAENEKELQMKHLSPGSTDRQPVSAGETRLRKLRKTCNSHEKVLLRGVVNPENIRTTFNDVHAPPETVEALKTLTTLSLTRPEAFKYGVLATDKISGALLYGPPGTGKTLLAKAVARESGATVLEVSGSDVYDMYVGEAEKNVRAVFSLARKLSPCVVFIDEADAIFASRGSGTNRNSHRELINQFLREWDGMTETNAFIMLATNRPFDLDDAALRRLPRRLLIDLPVEKDRESILRIHLKNELLDPAVSLSELAAQTPLYSGSDLKNLAVAAALAAVREENENAAQHKGSEAYVFPEKRTLTPKHFETAMQEITSSVSEDMSSLGAIRKFDEKYGDRRGKKRKTVYGFAGDAQIREDTAKVRH